MVRTAALTARWQGCTITMGPLGRDRRVRARTSKRRTPGQRDEESGCYSENHVLLQVISRPVEKTMRTADLNKRRRGSKHSKGKDKAWTAYRTGETETNYRHVRKQSYQRSEKSLQIDSGQRRAKICTKDWPRLECKARSDSKVIWLNCVATFEVSSAAISSVS